MRPLARTWAKSPPKGERKGELLTTHLTAAEEAAQLLRQRIGLVPVLPGGFWRWARLACLLHDAGKIPEGFQRQVGNGPGPARPWGERHEVLSLGFVDSLLRDHDDRLWVGLGIVTHHRPLTGSSGRDIFSLHNETDPDEFSARFGAVCPALTGELAEWLGVAAIQASLISTAPLLLKPADLGRAAHALLESLRERWEYEVNDRLMGLTAVLLQGAVTLADHVSSAHGALHLRQPMDAGFADRLTSAMVLHDHQKRAAAVQGHLLLRAPTGSGKTEAAELWAVSQVQAIQRRYGGQPRVFYTLPYLASINAMAERLGEHLGDETLVGVAHSKAASYHLNRSLCDEDDRVEIAQKAVSRAKATKLFQELVRVGTPYQLMRGALAGPAHAGLLIDAANSVFILDELHAYDPRRLGIILAMVGLWKELGGRIAIISATLPTTLEKLLGGALGEGMTPVDALDGNWPTRHRLSVREEHLTSSVAEIEDRLRAGESVLVVANNVADARTLYGTLGPLARERHGEDAALLLHSRFRAGDRATIEKRIRDRYGVGRPPRPGLLVATQVVEVSLNVDFTSIHTSGAPLEALLQRFGRVNRVGERAPADVVVHEPDYRSRPGWADGVYEEEPTRLAMGILSPHDGTDLDERVTGEWLNEIYDSPWGARWAEETARHQEEFSEAFLRFDLPFDDRTELAKAFDRLFDGAEAVLRQDLDDYRDAMDSSDEKAAGKLLAAEYLLPIPAYGIRLGRYDRTLGVLVIDAEYDWVAGLGTIHAPSGERVYLAGEVL